jgi:hypothetical protein
MTMKLAISAAALILFAAASAPVYAQHEQEGKKDEGKSQQHHEQASKPAQHQQAYGGVYHGGVKADDTTHGGVHHSGVPQHQGQVRSGFAQSRAKSWNDDHRSWSKRGGYNGYRVPDERFRAYFGRDHFFRIHRLPMVFVGGYPRFQYDGYWVTFMDPWPEGWDPNWWENDDVYIDYNDDGYYLYNRRYPGVPIAVTVSF